MYCILYKDVSGECFLKRFLSDNYYDNSPHSLKILADIDERIKWAMDHPCQEREDLFEWLPPHKFGELKIRDKDKWIRILSFFDKDDDRLLLISAYYKPYRYNSPKEKKEVKKMIEEENKKADLYLEDYLKNKEKRYEKYPT